MKKLGKFVKACYNKMEVVEKRKWVCNLIKN